MLRRQPADCSVAEIAAASIHVSRCKTCEELIKAARDAAIEKCSPLEIAFAESEAKRIKGRVAKDHEALAMLVAAELERRS